MSLYLQTLGETAQIVVPIFLLLAAGFGLRRGRVIDEAFVTTASRLVFNLALPILIFVSVARADVRQLFDSAQLFYVYGTTVGLTLALYLAARRWIAAPADQGVFVQGAFRGNFGIIGLAVIFNMQGEAGLAPAALLLALIIPLYNLLAVLVLSLPHRGGPGATSIGRSLLANPLILAVLLALPFSLGGWSLPPVLGRTGDYFADLTLPLALLAIGGSLDLRYLRVGSRLALISSGLKLVLIPLVLTLGALLVGFRGDDLARLFVLFGCPTAAASFVMARVMNGNPQLAASIVALTTLASIPTLGTGIYLLKLFG